jgi:hypothetical protein
MPEAEGLPASSTGSARPSAQFGRLRRGGGQKNFERASL